MLKESCVSFLLPVWQIVNSIGVIPVDTCADIFGPPITDENGDESFGDSRFDTNNTSNIRLHDRFKMTDDQIIAHRNFGDLVIREMLGQTNNEEQSYFAKWNTNEVYEVSAVALMCLLDIVA